MWPFSSSSSSSNNAEASTSSAPAAASAPSVSNPPSSPSVTPSATSESDATAYLRTHTFTTPAPTTYVPSTTSLLSDPALDVSLLHPMAGLQKEDLEYLELTDTAPSSLEGGRTAVPSRGWSDDLCYGTGTTYLSGLAIGGLLGAREGLSRPLGVDNPTFRLRLNAVLNQVTRRGSFFGNSAGVVALIYNLADAAIDAARGKHDIYGAVVAGGMSGALFKCTAGVRPMATASAIMMAAAAGWTTAKQALI
ncbi:Mitochondrial import inner membrane translocase subunit tim23 [Thecaphora frezii]